MLEDWQHVAQYKQYITKQKTVIMGGPNGVTGHIGWFIPTYLMKQHPEFKTWKGLKGKESIFKSPESGSQGMFLGGDPSYVQKDKQLIQALKLNLKFVSVGAEPAQVARWSQLYRQHKPVLFYWYTPQYLNKQYQLSEVKLPPRFKGCQDDSKAGGSVAKYKCAYDTIVLNKVFSKKFANGGSPAYGVLKRFKWTNSDQETVAKWIAGDHMNPDKAGKKWVDSQYGQGRPTDYRLAGMQYQRNRSERGSGNQWPFIEIPKSVIRTKPAPGTTRGCGQYRRAGQTTPS